jgi:phosphoadenosine phosphosulfate reductase
LTDRPRLLHSSDEGSDLPNGPIGSQGANPPLFPTEELLAELRECSERFETATAEEILEWAVGRFGDKFTMATAFGPEGMVILEMLSRISPKTYVFNLDTGYQFPETLQLRELVKEKYGIEVDLLKPELSVFHYEKLHNGPLYETNSNQCCFDRKIKVLQRAALGRHAWASAIRRDQSPDRAKAPIIAWDKKFHLVKVSPLANWTKSQVWNRILLKGNEIPYNPLHDAGYPSIGCWPCTRRVMMGEDDRAGRWSGTAKTECGLHTTEDGPSNG